jgi:hypothetical protein
MTVAAGHLSSHIFGKKPGAPPTPSSQRKALATDRRRIKAKGFLRLEVHVRKDDAPLVRSIVSALADPEHGAETRALLREHFAVRPTLGLKALLASAPLEDIDLTRPRDLARDIDLRLT